MASPPGSRLIFSSRHSRRRAGCYDAVRVCKAGRVVPAVAGPAPLAWHEPGGSYYRLVLEDFSTRLQGYVLTGTRESPEALVLHIRQPPGRTPIRIRLLGRWTLKEPAEVPPDGLFIDSTEWATESGSGESLTVHFANGQTLAATCKQVALDVS